MFRAKALTATLLFSLLTIAPSAAAKDDSTASSSSSAAKTTAAKTTAAEVVPEMDITDERARRNRGTAHTLAPGQWGIRTGIMGTRPNEIYGALGVDRGFEHGFQLGINLLHASAGLLNLEAKWMFLERGPWAVGATFAPAWIHGDWVWLSRYDQVVGNIDVLAFPLGITTSVLANDWLQFDLVASYVHVEIFGELNSSSLLFDTDFALQQLKLTPTIRLHPEERLSLYFSAAVPLWTQAPGALEAEVVLTPGVVAGGRSSGNKAASFGDLYLFTLGARAMVSHTVFIDFALGYGSVTERLYDSKVSPKLAVEFRF